MIRFTADPASLRPLFTDHRQLRAVREAVLEGRVGEVWVERLDSPSVARLDVGCYSLFGGDSSLPAAAEAIRCVAAPQELIFPNDGWRRLMLETLGPRLADRPMASFSAVQMEASHLRSLVAALADGYRLCRLEAGQLAQLDEELQPHGLQTYASAEQLASHGMAWGALAGDELACAATSYAMASDCVEVAIATRPQHRGRGLATATAARFCLEALASSVEPLWNASNPVSQRLAFRLGFVRAGTCEVLYMTLPSA